MKRVVFSVLSICMIFSTSLSGFANSANYIDNSSRIEMVFSSEAERDAFVHSDQYDPSARYLFVIESSESVTTRAVCYFCGKNTMGIATMEEDYGAAVLLAHMILFVLIVWKNIEFSKLKGVQLAVITPKSIL